MLCVSLCLHYLNDDAIQHNLAAFICYMTKFLLPLPALIKGYMHVVTLLLSSTAKGRS